MAESNYDALKSEIKERSVSPEKLEEIKDQFEDEINSVRLMSCIQSIDDILDTLERRDVINEEKTNALESIVEILDNNTNKKLVNDQSLEQSNSSSENELAKLHQEFQTQMRLGDKEIGETSGYVPHIAAAARIPMQENNPLVNTDRVSSGFNNRTVIYNLIATEIGHKWRDFGRGLCIREGEMDELEKIYPTETHFKRRIIKMLEIFEEPGREDPRKHLFMISESLIECGRRDLSKKIQEILTR